LKITPNPAHDWITIDFNGLKGMNAAITIYDLTGRLVGNIYTGTTKQGNNPVRYSVKNLTTGIYFIKFNNGDRTITKKIVIQKQKNR
jgi:hypothetical protein